MPGYQRGYGYEGITHAPLHCFSMPAPIGHWLEIALKEHGLAKHMCVLWQAYLRALNDTNKSDAKMQVQYCQIKKKNDSAGVCTYKNMYVCFVFQPRPRSPFETKADEQATGHQPKSPD